MDDKIKKIIYKINEEQNNRGLLDFEGYSPIEMQYILKEL